MSDDQFERWLLEALQSLPADYRDRLDNLEIMVAPEPTAWQRRAVATGYDLYGLYEGIPLTARTSTGYGAVEPDRITLFSTALRRDYPHPDELQRQIRRVLYHEIAHHFGISDDRLHELGAY